MNNTKVNSDPIDLQLIDSVNNLNVISDTITVASIGTESIHSTTTTAESSGSGSGSLLGWINVGFSICIAIVIWKIIKTTSSEIQRLQRKLNENDEVIKNALQTIEKISNEVQTLKGKLTPTTKSPIPKKIEPTIVLEEQDNKYMEVTRENENPKQVQIKFATLQSPDENGILRFSERSMIENSSPQKMFLVEIDTIRGIGTYRINPSAKNLILGDLQMFRDFVKPFTFSGDSVNATIQDKIPGKISKQGNFWVVEELLEISIN